MKNGAHTQYFIHDSLGNFAHRQKKQIVIPHCNLLKIFLKVIIEGKKSLSKNKNLNTDRY